MLAMALATATAIAATGNGGDGLTTKKWTSAAEKLSDAFFATPEAERIGDNLLFYQHPTGGWPKNTQMQDSLTAADRKRVEKLEAGQALRHDRQHGHDHRDKIPGTAVRRHQRREVPRCRHTGLQLPVRGTVR